MLLYVCGHNYSEDAMRDDELVSLVPTIADELAAGGLRDDVQKLDDIFVNLLTAHKMTAYEALGALEDLMADISAVPERSMIKQEEWDARRADICRAAQLYLDARWKASPPAKSH
jgi:hypothetical protein